jgi:amidase
MTFDEYNRYDAVGLARLIASGEVSSAEVTEAAITAIESLNPGLNAVIAPMFDMARESVSSGLPDGPLSGVPYLVKDLNTWVAGVPAVNGCRALQNFVPTHDSILVSRIRAAGLVILGKTNTPEFGLNICTSPVLFGPTRNPFDAERSAGGSSGGSACAVAAGMLPAAHATDSGGSIRIPASNCGLFGLKPTRARVPLGNDQAEGLAGFSAAHAVSHSVRDSAQLLDLTAGPMVGDIYCAPSPTIPFSQCIEGPLPKLRVALWTEGFADESVSDSCQAATRNAASLCESVGCDVEEMRPPIDGHALRRAFDVIFGTTMRNVVTGITAAYPDHSIESLVEPVTLACSESASQFSAVDYATALQVTQQAARSLGQFFEHYDVLLTPTLANPPLPLGAMDMQTSDWSVFLEKLLDEIPFTPLFNATGAPAASLPLGKCSDGLPVGVQIGAALGGETTLLCLASALEQAAAWHQRI